MGAWGHGPLETDDAADVIGAVRYVLDRGWEPLRGDEIDDEGLALADEAATITLALVRAGIAVQPDDREELVEAWDDALSATIVAALSAERATERPGFPDERAVERWLRDGGATYEVWMKAATLGDDRVAAWDACTDAPTLFTMARLVGVPDSDLARALAACVRSLLTSDDATVLHDALARLGNGEPIDKDTVDRISGVPVAAGDRLSGIVTTTYDLARGGMRHALARLNRLADVIEDLGARLHPALDPLVRDRL